MEGAVPCGKLSDLGDMWREYDVVGIDEGQFFPDLLPFAEAVANAGKIVVISALDGTFQRKVLRSCVSCC
jgi:thymidine kinase